MIKKEIIYFFPHFFFFIHSWICNDLYRLRKYTQQMVSVFTTYFSAFFLSGNIMGKQERPSVLQFLTKTESEWQVFKNNRKRVILYNAPEKLSDCASHLTAFNALEKYKCSIISYYLVKSLHPKRRRVPLVGSASTALCYALCKTRKKIISPFWRNRDKQCKEIK